MRVTAIDKAAHAQCLAVITVRTQEVARLSHQVQKPDELSDENYYDVKINLGSWSEILLILLRFNLPDSMKFKI